MNKPNNKKEFTLIQKIKFSLFILLIGILIITIAGELILTLQSSEPNYSEKTNLDESLGWVPKENFSMEYNAKEIGPDGKEYPVKYQTQKHGFRSWGNVNATNPKVLFIGDSYVQSVEVSNDKTFYSIIGDSLDIEVFAFGQAGYGTLQQKMILDKYINAINPSLIVWQSCDNDFLDNNPMLEYNSLYTVGLRRPYCSPEGKIYFSHPKPKWMEWVDRSKFLELLRKKINNTANLGNDNYSLKMISEKGKEYQDYADVLKSTNLILKDMKNSAGTIPIIGFSASPFEPQLSDMKQLSEQNGIPFYGQIGVDMSNLKNGPIKYFTSDEYHWNEAGQQKVANMLLPIIKSHLANIQ